MANKNIAKRIEIKNYIEEYTFNNGGSPSFREIAEAVSLASSTVSLYIDRMKEEGMLTSEGTSRSLKVI